MRANGWKSACRKLGIAMPSFYRYDTVLSGGGHRRSLQTGEEKCIRNSLLSRWRQSFWQDVTRTIKVLGLELVSALLVLRLWVVTRSWVQGLELSQLLHAMKASFVPSSINNSALTRSSEISKGMSPVRGVPFCLPKA